MIRQAFRQIAVIVRKELKDSLRDRRALFSIAFTVIVGPVLIGFMMNRAADREREAEEVQIPVVGSNYAPAFIAWLQQQPGVEVTDGPADPEAAVRDRAQDVVLIITPEFADRFRVSRPAMVKLVTDSSRAAARPKVERVRRLLQRYSSEIGSLRLIARGVSPSAMSPLGLEEIEVSTAQQRAAQVLTFIPLFIVLAAFVGGLQIATDSTAGERERGSLEPLLVNPAPRAVFAAGKILAAALMAVITVALSTALCANIPRFLPLQDLGIRFRIAPEQFAAIMAAVAPMCLFSASLQACIATMARSFKEAQSYMGVLILLPMLPGMMSTIYSLGGAIPCLDRAIQRLADDRVVGRFDDRCKAQRGCVDGRHRRRPLQHIAQPASSKHVRIDGANGCALA
jgi:sodium transport system permease protein